MKYIMVTNWYNHWNRLKDNKTYFGDTMFRRGMNKSKFKENTPTTFIKLNKETKEVEKAWQGRVYNIHEEGKKIHFKVFINKEIICPKRYIKYGEGWYFENWDEIKSESETIFDPKFFKTLTTTENWGEFEDLVYYLLKVLGIHKINKFTKQKGEPDGFFKVKNFAVIYDATLDKDFMKSKETQIENFCSQLDKSSIKIGKETMKIKSCNKNVWIITKNGFPEIIKNIDDIKIKKVPVCSLIELFHKRMLAEDIEEFDFEKELQNL